MKLFAYTDNYHIVAVVSAFNRGHAVKQLAKFLESKGLQLLPSHPIQELDLEEDKKGKVFLLRE